MSPVTKELKPLKELEDQMTIYLNEMKDLPLEKKEYERKRLQEEFMRIILKLDALTLDSDRDRDERRQAVVQIQSHLRHLDTIKSSNA